MPVENPVADVAHLIQLSVAPVFLMTAIGTVLGVLSTRLGRIVDRYRVLSDRLSHASGEAREDILAEMDLLARRRKLVNVAIACGVGGALSVAAVMGGAFLGFMVGWKMASTVAVLFLLAMLLVVTALFLLLREVLDAALNVREHRR